MRRAFLFILLFLALHACTRATDQTGPHFFAKENPPALSQWGLFRLDGGLTLAEGVVPYDLNSTLFTDYALKLRTIWVPEGVSGSISPDGHLSLPVGSIISKTFYYPKPSGAFSGDILKVAYQSGAFDKRLNHLDEVRLIETRLLVHRDQGWEALSYVWNDQQTDARLTRIGDIQSLLLNDEGSETTAFAYVVPNMNQCAACHAENATSKIIGPIGLKQRHMDKDYDYGQGQENQLTHLALLGYIGAPTSPNISPAIPANVDWRDESKSLPRRARAYLDINCSHCHNQQGAADTSGLDLTPEAQGAAMGRCKLPIAAGAGTGDRLYDIVPGHPDQSVLLYRLETTKPDAMMPELGRSLAHKEAVALIRAWIAAMEKDCGQDQ